MNHGADAADRIVRYSLDGTELLLRLSGSAAKNFATFAIAMLKDNNKTHGKTRLVRMLKERRAMKFFTVPSKRISEFTKEAKMRGLLFVPIKDNKKPKNIEVAVFADDATKINRIMDRMSIDFIKSEAGGAVVEDVTSSVDEQKQSVSAALQNGGNAQVQSAHNSNSQIGNQAQQTGTSQQLNQPLQSNLPQPINATTQAAFTTKTAPTPKTQNSEVITNFTTAASASVSPSERSSKQQSSSQTQTADDLRAKGEKPSVKKELSEIRAVQSKNANNVGKGRGTKQKSRAPRATKPAR